MRRSLSSLTNAVTRVIPPKQSSKFHAAIFNPHQALVLKKDGKLQVGALPDSEILRDIEFNPEHFSSTAISKSYSYFPKEYWEEFLSYLNPTIVGNLKL